MVESLYVTSDFLRNLAQIQKKVASDIESDINSVSGISSAVAKTHGSLCAPLNLALRELETTRRFTGTGMHLVATQLADNLSKAASRYQATDGQTADYLNKCMHP